MKKYQLFTYIYNDEDILPFFLDYYKWVDQMTFIDSNSNDRTLDILQEFANTWDGELRLIQTACNFYDIELLHEYRNLVWHDSKFDLVLFPDCDEFFYTANGIKNYLDNTKFDIYECEGFEMVCEKMPKIGTKITDIKTGVRHHVFNKSTIFNPKIDIEFLNAHLRYSRCKNVDLSGSVKLLHYRSLGLDLVMKRNKRTADRVPKGYRVHKPESDAIIKARFYNWLKQATAVI